MTYFFDRGWVLTPIVLAMLALPKQFRHFENAVRKGVEQYSISLIGAELLFRSTLRCALRGEAGSKN